MVYELIIKRTAEKELDGLPDNIRQRIIKNILALELEPRPIGVKKLQGQDAFRLRVGDYRILYTINDSGRIVTIFAIGHRREVYR